MMDAQIRRRRTLEAIKRIIIRESLKQPLVVIFEDLHWIDAETQELLDLLVDSVASARILMLVNYRPEYHHEWGNRAYYTQLRLDPLGGQSADEMLHALLGEDASLQSLKRLIIDKTQGNPFFMEEIVRALVEQGVLVRNGATRLTKPLTEIHIPPTVHGILASRIDALSASEKDLLQTLAVIGKDFSLNLVRHITASPDDRLERMLKGLQAGEFIYEQPASGEAEYTFKHALTQEVAYNSMLIERRRLLHERTGEAIETLFKDRIDDHLAELAHHYSRTANTRKAVEYLFRAGSPGRSAFRLLRSGRRLSSALELLKHLPDDTERARQELSVRSVLGRSLANAKGWAAAELEPVYARARELCAQIRDPALAFPCSLWTMANVSVETGAAQRSRIRRRTSGCRQGCERPGDDPGRQLRARRLVFFSSASWSLRMSTWRRRWQSSTSGNLFPRGWSNCRVGSFFCLHSGLLGLGYPDRAWAISREMLEVAQRSSAPYVLVLASAYAAFHKLTGGNPTAAQKRAEQAMAVTEELGLVSLSAMATTCYGAALIVQGRYQQGIAGMRRGISAFRATGGASSLGLCAFLASGSEGSDGPRKALQVVEEGFASVAKTGERISSPSLHHVKGELLLAQNPSDSAKRSDVSARRSKSLGGKVRDRRSCVPRRASPGCSRSRPVATKRARCSPKSTAGSPRV